MKYENITMKGDDTNVRYVLKKEGRNMLVVLGVNPSKATDKISDSTMTKVMGFAKYNGYDGFIMLNLYPQRCTNPNELDKEMSKELHQQNLKYIVSEINNMKSVSLLFAFGDTIARRHYLRNCLQDIISLIAPKNLHCLQIGELTKMGNPRHPSRAGYCTFLPFDVNKYLL